MAVLRWRQGLSFVQFALALAVSFAVGLASPEVDKYGHLGGAAGGALIAYLWGPRCSQPLGGLLVRDAPIIRWPFV